MDYESIENKLAIALFYSKELKEGEKEFIDNEELFRNGIRSFCREVISLIESEEE